MTINHQTNLNNSQITPARFFAAFLVLLVSVGLLCACQKPATVSELFKSSDTTYDIMETILTDQAAVDKQIEKELADPEHSFEDPLVMQDPYGLSPLSALIIFTTEESTPIDMVINDRTSVGFESSTTHALPVYGLFDGYDNKVELRDGEGNTTTLTITTEAYEGGVMSVESNELPESEEVFLVSPDFENTSAFTADGRLLWYLDNPDMEGAVVFTGGDKFLISDFYQGTDGTRISYSGFLEMDYLGKVHKQYIGEYGYHHEILPIKGGSEYLLPGTNYESPFIQAVVYSVDAKTMQVKQVIDFYEVLNGIAPDWVDAIMDHDSLNFCVNGIDYDESTGDVLASVRSVGMIIRINLETSQIKWIFADPAIVPAELQQYLLTPTDDTRYPYGQHATQFLDGNRILYHNNNIDFRDQDQKLSHHEGHYASNEILVIDEANKTLHTEWTFDANKEVISKMSGSIELLDNGHKLLSFGSAIKDSAYEATGKPVVIGDVAHTQGLMMELGEGDEVLWRATFPGIMHKVYKTTFYGNEVLLGAEGGAETAAQAERFPNYQVESYERIDGQDIDGHAGEEVDIDAFLPQLVNAAPLEGHFHLYVNRALPEVLYEVEDEVSVLFVSEDGEGRSFVYKKANELPRIINSGMYGTRIVGLRGKQKAYVCIAGTYYDTGQIIDFG